MTGQRYLALAVAALASISSVYAQSDTSLKCGAGSLCPKDSPCCSQYGSCGVGGFCLGGCDPLHSFELGSCVAEPVCKSNTYQLNSLDNMTDQRKYLGDSSKTDWVYSGTPLQAETKDSVILTLAEDGLSGSGTLLASSTYVWYGKITAVMKSSRGAGVVSAFILLSDSKDEIDFEFVGTDLNTVQSNYYYQGITNYENSKNISVSKGGNTYGAYHTYEIDWQPDQLTWSVDGDIKRTLRKSDTFNKTDNQYHYPQTPARVQLSLWPAGLAKNPKGTIDWSGGLISWGTQDVVDNGYYYSFYKSIEIECYKTPSNIAFNTGSKSYVFNDRLGLEKSVGITGNDTVLKSLLGTGTDMDKDYPEKASGTHSASSTAAATNVNTIPGLTGAGPGTDGSRGGGESSSGTNTGSDSSNNNAGTSPNPSSTGIGGFSQGTSSQAQAGTKNVAPHTNHGTALSILVVSAVLLGLSLM